MKGCIAGVKQQHSRMRLQKVNVDLPANRRIGVQTLRCKLVLFKPSLARNLT